MKKFKDEINPHNFSDSISVAFQNGMINAKDLIFAFAKDFCEHHVIDFNSFKESWGGEKQAWALLHALGEYLKD